MRRILKKQGYGALGLGMVAATITLIGFVAFQTIEVQDNREVASTTEQTKQPTVATIDRPEDVDVVTAELDTAELDALDAELDATFDF